MLGCDALSSRSNPQGLLAYFPSLKALLPHYIDLLSIVIFMKRSILSEASANIRPSSPHTSFSSGRIFACEAPRDSDARSCVQVGIVLLLGPTTTVAALLILNCLV